MAATSKNVTARNLALQLRVKREALLRHYDDKSLHRLRVVLRRLRSLLRHIEDDNAQALRAELAVLADATNAARDWDTLVARAHTSLKPKRLRRVQHWLDEGRNESHQPVLVMLHSQQWEHAIHGLAQYIESGELQSPGNEDAEDDIDHAKEDVQNAWDRVESDEDSKHWHKLRIVIKELRYTFDQLPRDALNPAQKKALRHCKRLQDTLGVWHDTVVHLQMVCEYADSLDTETQSKLDKTLKAWRKQMESELHNTLKEANSFLEGKGSDLLR